MGKYNAFAWALGIVGVTTVLTYFDVNRTNKNAEIEIAKAKTIELTVQDLNGNGIPEKFYEHNGKKYFLEIDGKNIENTLR